MGRGGAGSYMGQGRVGEIFGRGGLNPRFPTPPRPIAIPRTKQKKKTYIFWLFGNPNDKWRTFDLGWGCLTAKLDLEP